jgi:hypothetical protein
VGIKKLFPLVLRVSIRRIFLTLNNSSLDCLEYKHRSLVQIKSHAQKVIKRYDNGEDVFARLKDNLSHVEAAVERIHEHMQHEGVVIPAPAATPMKLESSSSRIRNSSKHAVSSSFEATAAAASPPPSRASGVGQTQMMAVHEEIVAASALFQLSGQSPAPLQTTTVKPFTNVHFATSDLRTIVLGSSVATPNVLQL